VLQFEDAPRPTPGSGELLIRVHAASVNPIDWKVRAGYMKAIIRRPHRHDGVKHFHRKCEPIMRSPHRERSPPTTTSSLSGKTPTPTSPSWSKLRRSTRSCN